MTIRLASRSATVHGTQRTRPWIALRAVGSERVERHLAAMQGRRASLLIERPGLGRTEGFAQTRLVGDHRPGAVVPARIVGREDGLLVAEAA